MANLGQLGEELVASWLQSQGWTILHHQWRCRWGEIDLIAQSSQLIFVEVKTRSQGNWDLDGLLAVNLKKQSKIGETAQYFLAEFPDLAEYPCRFDVALVRGQKLSDAKGIQTSLNHKIELNQPIIKQGYQLTIINYIESAFSA